MAGASNAIGNQVSRMQLAVDGAKSFSSKLPKEAGVAASALAKQVATISKLNAKQEEAKRVLAETTKLLAAEIKAAQANRGKIVKLAEATFGSRGAELRQFRPATEGKVRKGKAPA
jgi:hypothetical protein